MPGPRRRTRVIPAVAAALLLAGCQSASAPAPGATTSGVGSAAGSRLLLVLDDSGSMAHRDASGRSRMQVAREALHQVVHDLPGDAQVGLRVYGSRVRVRGRAAPGSPACTDSLLVSPVAPLDRGHLDHEVDAFTPHGDTPIGYTLRQVGHDLGGSGERAVVLVSDGEESCSADPCADARSLGEQGIGAHVHTVGLDVDDSARRQLSCIADATGGTYHDATSSDLTRSIAEAVATARRPTGGSATSWLDGGQVNPGIVGAALLLLLLGWIVVRERRRDER